MLQQRVQVIELLSLGQLWTVVYCRLEGVPEGSPINRRKVILGNLTFVVRATVLGTVVGSVKVVVVEDFTVGSVEVIEGAIVAITVEAVVLGGVVVGDVSEGSPNITGGTMVARGGSKARDPIWFFKTSSISHEPIVPSLYRYPHVQFLRQCQYRPL